MNWVKALPRDGHMIVLLDNLCVDEQNFLTLFGSVTDVVQDKYSALKNIDRGILGYDAVFDEWHRQGLI